MLKRFLRWFFDLDSLRKHSVLKSSITGKPLVIFDMGSGSRGWSIRNTPEGMRGAAIMGCFQLHFSMETARSILLGEYDDYLTKDCKFRGIKKIQSVLEKGYYIKYEHLDPYDPGFELIKVPLKSKEKLELAKLISIN